MADTHKWSEVNESHSVGSDSLRPHGLYSPRNSSGQNTGVGSLSFFQGIFPTRGSSRPRDQTQVSYIAGGYFTIWAIGGVLWWGLNWWKALWIHYPFAQRPSFTQVSSRNMNSIPILWEINFLCDGWLIIQGLLASFADILLELHCSLKLPPS